MAYNAAKAAEYNKLIQQGIPPAAAAAQAGIGANDFDYQLNSNGSLGPINLGQSKVAGVDYDVGTGTGEATTTVSSSRVTTFSSYTSTSTEQVSGGGSTTIVSNRPIVTASSEAFAVEASAKQAEINQFVRDNPSNFARKKQGLPPLSPEETLARQSQLDTLSDQRTQLTNSSLDAQQSVPPTTYTVPNTTTTTQTTTTGIAVSQYEVDSNNDQVLSQQTELQLETTTTRANAQTAYTGEFQFDPQQDVGENVFDSGATFNGPATQESVFDTQQDIGESVFDPAGAAPNPAVKSAAELNNPYYGLSPAQLEALGGADPTDPFIRARLGIPQLPGTTLNANGSAAFQPTGVPLIDNAVSAISNFASSLTNFFSPATKPAVTTQGTTTGTPATTGVNTKEAAAEAAAVKEQNPNLSESEKANLDNIQIANAEVTKAEENIQANNRNILAAEEGVANARENQRSAEANIAQNNAELADETISPDRRAELEANNATQFASIAENAQYIDDTTAIIETNEENNQQQQASIQENRNIAQESELAYTASNESLTILSEEETTALFDGTDPALVSNFVEAETNVTALSEEETAALFPDEAVDIEPPPLAAPGEPGGPPLLTDAEIATIYGVTDPQEVGAIQGTLITTDEARAALSDPETIRAQEALNREVLENPATLPDVTVTKLTDAEAANLFEEAEANPNVIIPDEVDPDASAELAEPPGTEVPFTELAEPPDPDADPEQLAGPEDLEPYTELAEPPDPDADPELEQLAGPEEEEPYIDLAEPVDPDADPELLAGPEEEEPYTDLAEPVDPDADPELEQLGGPPDEDGGPELLSGPDEDDASDTISSRNQAQAQATIQQRYNQSTQGDWRVRLRLAPGANYLYNDPTNKLLAPLRVSNGLIFPYTPQISTNFSANYDKYDLTHSNYRGYFYKNSTVGDISINGTFTAQDTAEAEYLLAVIVFLRSATKMFYGKDEFKGAPPPLVELSGYGQYQFNNHPCLIHSFNYSLPTDVDYIRVTPNNQGINLSNRQARVSSSPVSTIQSVLNRLDNAGLARGATASPGDLGVVNSTVAGLGQSTYVPTKMEIQLTLFPVQTRQQVSQLFSVKNFANGNLLKGGFW